jgi:PKD repeat protein
MSTGTRILGVAALVASVACTVKETPAPPLAGPSELAMRVALQAVPDSIMQDGVSQSAIQIEASGPDGRPVRALPLRIETFVGGVLQDFGTLSSKTPVTGEDGRARVVYTAPPRPAEPVDNMTVVTFVVTPIGTDYRGEEGRSVDLRLVTPGVILPPNGAPEAAFEFTPEAPLPLQNVVFDASGSMDDGAPCGPACSYRWDFGDGKTGNGMFVSHQYAAFGTYTVRLTVTDTRGASSTMGRAISVGELAQPTAEFVFSPTAGIATGQVIFFNAEASRAASGRRLVSYQWDFGSGRTGTGVTTSKAYDNPGQYTVTLTVTDDAGATDTVSRSVEVGLVDLTATFTVSPSSSAASPQPVSTLFLFDASASNGPSRIVEYRFSLGDGSPDAVQPTLPTWTYQYKAAGVYNVVLTVKDVTGRSAMATRTIYVR